MPLIIKNKQKLFQGKFLSVWATTFLDKDNNENVWEWIEKKDAVMVLAITRDNKVILIRNFRVPLEKFVIEAPAGLLDKKNENPEEAARRELLEETGYSAENFITLPSSPYSAATAGHMFHYFIATDAEKVSETHGDASEDLSVIEIPAHELMNYYLNTTELFNPTILALFYIALEKGLVRVN